LTQLSSLRKVFNFIAEITTDEVLIEQEKNTRNTRKSNSRKCLGAVFIHLNSGWKMDQQPLKTDIYIEKSVKLSFDLMNMHQSTALLTLENLFSKKNTKK
jgi:ribosome-associated toxin RatA of RatAB toxin-antitoxin module